MQPFDDQLERLKKAVGADSDTALACHLGITQGSMSGAKAKKRIPPAWFFLISDKTGVSVDFLYSGNGETGPTGEQQSDVSGNCPSCAILERALLRERQERQMLNQENKELLRENGELKGQIRVLREWLNAGGGGGKELAAAATANPA